MTEHNLIRTSIFVLYPGDLGTILFFTAWVFQVYLAAVFNVVMQYSSPPPSLLSGEEYCVTTLKTAARTSYPKINVAACVKFLPLYYSKLTSSKCKIAVSSRYLVAFTRDSSFSIFSLTRDCFTSSKRSFPIF